MKYTGLAIVTTAALLLSACGKKDETAPTKTIQEIQAEQGIPVTTQQVAQGTIRHIERAGGTAQGIQQTVLANGLGGSVKRINVKVGQKIRKGATVAVMEFEEGSPVDVAQSNYDYASQVLTRANKLLEEGAVSMEQVEGARVQYENAKRALGQAKAGENVTTPFAGTVLEIFENPGSKISEKTPLVKVADLSKMEIELWVNERAINLYEQGQKAFVIVDGDTLWGEVTRTALGGTEMTHGFRVTTVFPNPENKLKVGMYKEVHVVVDAKDDAFYIPIEVVEGLSAGDQIVITGITMINDGSKVNVVNN